MRIKYFIIIIWWYGLICFQGIFFPLSYKRDILHDEKVYEAITGFYRWLNAQVEAEAFDDYWSHLWPHILLYWGTLDLK